ncbi:MAG: hypothetical protein HOV83_38565 [Catenulispora sp.]|nr:hypothetical protein [Catenulispora sp.]
MADNPRDGGLWSVAWSYTVEKSGDEVSEHVDTVGSLPTAVVNGRRVVISGGADGTVRLWDPAAGGPVGEPLTGHDGAVTAVAATVMDERPHAVTLGRDGTVRLWDLAGGRQVGPAMSRYPAKGLKKMRVRDLIAAFAGISLHQVFALATAETGTGPVAIVAGEDGAQVWDLATSRARGEPLIGKLVMAVVTADTEGRSVAIMSEGASRVRLWDLDSGTPIGELPGEVEVDGVVTALSVGEVDGRTVILTARVRPPGPTRIQMWDPVTRLPTGEAMGDREDLLIGSLTVAVLGERACVIAGGAVPPGRGVVVAWDAATGRKVGETQLLPSIVSAVVPYPDGPEGSLAISFGSDIAVLTPR